MEALLGTSSVLTTIQSIPNARRRFLGISLKTNELSNTVMIFSLFIAHSVELSGEFLESPFLTTWSPLPNSIYSCLVKPASLHHVESVWPLLRLMFCSDQTQCHGVYLEMP